MASRRSALAVNPSAAIIRERDLIDAARADPARFAELYEENFPRVYAYVACRIRDRAETEDITSEVFHRALANLPRFEWRGVPFAAWLYKIAANAIADRMNRAQRAERASFELAISGTPPDSAEEIEHRARLFAMVGELPADQRRVISLRFAEQKSISEIARELGRSEGAIKQLQFRGLRGLRARLGDIDE